MKFWIIVKQAFPPSKVIWEEMTNKNDKTWKFIKKKHAEKFMERLKDRYPGRELRIKEYDEGE